MSIQSTARRRINSRDTEIIDKVFYKEYHYKHKRTLRIEERS